MKLAWSRRLRYSFATQAVKLYFGSLDNFTWSRHSNPAAHREHMRNAFGLYCMGGEL